MSTKTDLGMCTAGLAVDDSQIPGVLRVLSALAVLFVFLVGVKTLEGSVSLLGTDVSQGLFAFADHPVIALFAGMLVTVLVQSSSVTTSMIVGLVSSRSLELVHAIPMVMGANIGTSVTNTLVSLGYVKNARYFKQAFAAGTLHDFFNLLTVVVVLPLEMATGMIQKVSYYLAYLFYGADEGVSFVSPLKVLLKPAVGSIRYTFESLGLSMGLVSLGMALTAVGLVILSLMALVRIMRPLVERREREALNRMVTRSAPFAMLMGAVFTFMVQSSSITTSLLIPFAGTGVLSLQAILPITIGANIGTTTTAMLAAMTGNSHGLAIAFCHLLINLLGTAIWFVHPQLRRVPILLSQALADCVAKSRWYAVAYVLAIFFALPLGVIYATLEKDESILPSSAPVIVVEEPGGELSTS